MGGEVGAEPRGESAFLSPCLLHLRDSLSLFLQSVPCDLCIGSIL